MSVRGPDQELREAAQRLLDALDAFEGLNGHWPDRVTDPVVALRLALSGTTPLLASSVCPICGRDTPHAHGADQIETWVNSRINGWGWQVKVYGLTYAFGHDLQPSRWGPSHGVRCTKCGVESGSDWARVFCTGIPSPVDHYAREFVADHQQSSIQGCATSAGENGVASPAVSGEPRRGIPREAGEEPQPTEVIPVDAALEDQSPNVTIQQIEAALEEVFRICTERWNGKEGWRTTIPADALRDSDIIISRALIAAQRFIERSHW